LSSYADWAPYIMRCITNGEDDRFVVFCNGHGIASAGLSPEKQYVSDLAVLPQYRRRGIASVLYNHIEIVLGYPLKPDPYHQTRDGQAFRHGRK
jgi:GNAT superfamily N-acetyltransferase